MSDLLTLLADHGVAAKKVAGTHGGEYHSACPVCGGRDRFHCWPLRPSVGSCPVPGVWGCRVCDKSGDIIAFLQHAGGLSYTEACARLNIRLDENRPVRLPARIRAEGIGRAEAKDLPPAIWRERNTKLAAHAHENLMNNPAELARLAGRGLNAEACARYRLGWLPGEKGQSWYTRPLKAWGLPEADGKKLFKFPRGLVIPRFAQVEGREKVIGLRIRRTDADRAEFAPDTKYLAFKGGAVTPLLIPAPPTIRTDASRSALVLVEAELDAMLVAEVARAAGLPCGALALVSNTARPDAATHAACSRAAALLLAMDMDPKADAGAKSTAKAVARWRASYPSAKDWPVPKGKDPGEGFAAGVDLALWLEAGLPAICLPAGDTGNQDGGKADTLGGSGPAQAAPADEAPSRAEQEAARLRHLGELAALMAGTPLSIRVRADGHALEGGDRWTTACPENWERFGKISEMVFCGAFAAWLDAKGVTATRLTALDLQQEARVGVSPQGGRPAKRPDEYASDREHSQPPCCETATGA